jgi:protein-S-isoprenylcysteine O-methyltransferase Ste14
MKIDIADLILVFILVQILLHFLAPIYQVVDKPYTYIGILLIILGFLPNLYYGIYFRKIKTAIPAYKEPTKLVTSGFFKISRNPIYLGMIILLIGVAILLGSLSPFIIPLIFFILIKAFNISYEEKVLEKKFGKKYLDYKNKVRRWI